MSFQEPPGAFDRDLYYRQASDWSEEQTASLRRSLRFAMLVAGGAGAIALLEGLALFAMMPLKTAVPYVVTVDRQSGYVETAQHLLPGGGISQRDAVIQSMLVQYVLAREGFDATDLGEQYRRVQIWSADAARQNYVRAMAKDNPDSPLNLYSASTTVKIVVKSVSILGPGSALVRFDSQRIDPASSSTPPISYSATIGFRFSDGEMPMKDRFINPLGFQVIRYRRDGETAGGGSAAPATSPFGDAR